MELRHHGIKGQKWGRRRFQNDDGSLTASGRLRYGDDRGPKKPVGARVDGYSKTKKPVGAVNNVVSNNPVKKPLGARTDGFHKTKKPVGAKIDGASSPKKPVSKKAPTKKKVESGKKSAGHVLSTLGKVAAANAVRMAENRQTASMVDNMMSGDFGSAYSNAWAASKYRNIYGMLD